MQFNPAKTALLMGIESFYDPIAIAISKIALRRMLVRAEELGYSSFLIGVRLGVGGWGAVALINSPVLGLVSELQEVRERPSQQDREGIDQKLLQYTETLLLVNEDIYDWMCARSSLVIAVWDGRPGKLLNELARAKAAGLKGMIFDCTIASYSLL